MSEPISHAEMIAAVKRAMQPLEATDKLRRAHGYDNEDPDIVTLRAVLAHLERTQWRDIANAPKDGAWMLLMWRKAEIVTLGWWGRLDPAEDHSWCVFMETVGLMPRMTIPDGWQPLPLPPSPETPR